MKILIVAALCNVVANLCLKKAALGSTGQAPLWGIVPAYAWNAFFIAGLFCFLGSVVAFTKVLQSLQINIAYPMMSSITFASVALASVFLFGEKFGITQGIGLALIVAGIALLSQPG